MTFLGAESRLPEVVPGLETEILPVGGGVDRPVGATAGGNPLTVLTHVGISDNKPLSTDYHNPAGHCSVCLVTAL